MSKPIRTKDRIFNSIKSYRYYVIIVLASLVALVLLPALKVSEGTIGWSFPTTQVEWFIWAISRVAVIVLSVTIFFSFVNQGKLKAMQSEEYKKADNIMLQLALVDKSIPRDPVDPKKWERTTKGKKVANLLLTSILSFIAFGQLLLGYDIKTLISYGLSVGMGIAFGFMTMCESMDMWSYGYEEFATWKKLQWEKTHPNEEPQPQAEETQELTELKQEMLEEAKEVGIEEVKEVAAPVQKNFRAKILSKLMEDDENW